MFFKRNNDDDPIANQDRKIRQALTAKAKTLAKRALPAQGQKLEPYIAEARGGYTAMLRDALSSYRGNSEDLFKSERGVLERNEASIRKQVEEKRERREALKAERDRLPVKDYSARSRVWIHVLIILLGLTEAIISKSALDMFTNHNNFLGLLVIIGFTTLYVILPHGVVLIYRKYESHPLRVWYYLGGLIVLIACFALISSLRLIFVNNGGTKSIEHGKMLIPVALNMWHFTALSVLFVIPGVTLAAQLESRDERMSNNRARDIDAELQSTEAELSSLERQLNDIPNRMYAVELKWSQRDGKADDLRQKINALFIAAVGAFVAEVRLYHPNPPACLDEPIAELQ